METKQDGMAGHEGDAGFDARDITKKQMKVVIDFVIEGKKEYEFDAEEQLWEFIESCTVVKIMQGGIRKLTIEC